MTLFAAPGRMVGRCRFCASLDSIFFIQLFAKSVSAVRADSSELEIDAGVPALACGTPIAKNAIAEMAPAFKADFNVTFDLAFNLAFNLTRVEREVRIMLKLRSRCDVWIAGFRSGFPIDRLNTSLKAEGHNSDRAHKKNESLLSVARSPLSFTGNIEWPRFEWVPNASSSKRLESIEERAR
jgi:hypothetical protein